VATEWQRDRRQARVCGARAVIDRTYPLDALVDASKYVESGQKIGNVVMIVR
jgi:hypothetical protein